MVSLKKARSRWYPIETITDAGYTNDLALLDDTPVCPSLIYAALSRAGRKRYWP